MSSPKNNEVVNRAKEIWAKENVRKSYIKNYGKTDAHKAVLIHAAHEVKKMQELKNGLQHPHMKLAGKPMMVGFIKKYMSRAFRNEANQKALKSLYGNDTLKAFSHLHREAVSAYNKRYSSFVKAAGVVDGMIKEQNDRMLDLWRGKSYNLKTASISNIKFRLNKIPHSDPKKLRIYKNIITGVHEFSAELLPKTTHKLVDNASSVDSAFERVKALNKHIKQAENNTDLAKQEVDPKTFPDRTPPSLAKYLRQYEMTRKEGPTRVTEKTAGRLSELITGKRLKAMSEAFRTGRHRGVVTLDPILSRKLETITELGEHALPNRIHDMAALALSKEQAKVWATRATFGTAGGVAGAAGISYMNNKKEASLKEKIIKLLGKKSLPTLSTKAESKAVFDKVFAEKLKKIKSMEKKSATILIDEPLPNIYLAQPSRSKTVLHAAEELLDKEAGIKKTLATAALSAGLSIGAHAQGAGGLAKSLEREIPILKDTTKSLVREVDPESFLAKKLSKEWEISDPKDYSMTADTLTSPTSAKGGTRRDINYTATPKSRSIFQSLVGSKPYLKAIRTEWEAPGLTMNSEQFTGKASSGELENYIKSKKAKGNYDDGSRKQLAKAGEYLKKLSDDGQGGFRTWDYDDSKGIALQQPTDDELIASRKNRTMYLNRAKKKVTNVTL